MDTADLKIFATVARLQGMNRAAEALNTVQSNVTARVRALERKIGRALFDRHSRGVALTAAGRRLRPQPTSAPSRWPATPAIPFAVRPRTRRSSACGPRWDS